jgi:hypothetical protein
LLSLQCCRWCMSCPCASLVTPCRDTDMLVRAAVCGYQSWPAKHPCTAGGCFTHCDAIQISQQYHVWHPPAAALRCRALTLVLQGNTQRPPCRDQWFPEPARVLALQGAEVGLWKGSLHSCMGVYAGHANGTGSAAADAGSS